MGFTFYEYVLSAEPSPTTLIFSAVIDCVFEGIHVIYGNACGRWIERGKSRIPLLNTVDQSFHPSVSNILRQPE